MELRHTFTIPVTVDEAWRVLLDVERIAPCLPGATLDAAEGDTYRGKVRVKVGPITVTYRGTARIAESDEASHRAVVEADGKEARGSGTAAARVTSTLEPHSDGTAVTVVTDLTVTGRPAQFGRGVMADVAGKLLDRFAECLSAELSAQPDAEEIRPGERGAAVSAALEPEEPGTFPPLEPTPPPDPSAQPPPERSAPPEPEALPLDAFALLGGPLAVRVLPVAIAFAFGVLLGWRLRGSRPAGRRR